MSMNLLTSGLDEETTLGAFPDGTARVDYGLVLQRLDLNLDELWNYGMFMALEYVPTMMERGFRLLAAGSQLTGAPGRVSHVWRRGAPLSTRGRGAQLAKKLQRYALAEDVTTLTPTQYDPERWLSGEAGTSKTPPPADVAGGSSVGSRVYLIDTIQVSAARMTTFVETKRKLMLPLLSNPKHGANPPWTLIASGWARGAGSPTAVNVWELPESDTLLRTMRRVSENTTYQEFVKQCVRGEDQHLLAPVDFYEPRPIRAGGADAPVVVYRG